MVTRRHRRRAIAIAAIAAVASIAAGILSACVGTFGAFAPDGNEVEAGNTDGANGSSDARVDGNALADGGDASTDASEGGFVLSDADLACKTASDSGAACQNCCAGLHDAGIKFLEAVTYNCVCHGVGADGGPTPPCGNECSLNYCADAATSPSANCVTCIQNAFGPAGVCVETASEKCLAMPDCAGFQACGQHCSGTR